ncbi:hypothetical protein B0H13DRAFT_1589744, partial [Mycena leptocephala]
EVTSAQKDLEGLENSAAVSGIMGVADTIVEVQSKAGDIESSLNVLIFKIDIIVRVGDKLAKASRFFIWIHPYANVAWKVLTSVYEAVKKQRETDGKIVELVRMMATTFSFVEDAESLPEGLENTSLDIIKQTVECAIFIREYTGKGFGGREARVASFVGQCGPAH